jgi:hypothetical protein
MEPEKIRLYLDEISLQCHLALDAYKYVEQYLDKENTKNSGQGSGSHIDERELLRNLHSFFSHIGNIAKLLWPRGNKKNRQHYERAEDRGICLRSLLRIPDTNHPLDIRELRNRLEHYDEDLDEWILRDAYPEVPFLSQLQATSNILVVYGFDEMRIFTYPEKCFIDQSGNYPKLYHLEPLVKSLNEMLDLVDQLGADSRPKKYIVKEFPLPLTDNEQGFMP